MCSASHGPGRFLHINLLDENTPDRSTGCSFYPPMLTAEQTEKHIKLANKRRLESGDVQSGPEVFVDGFLMISPLNSITMDLK